MSSTVPGNGSSLEERLANLSPSSLEQLRDDISLRRLIAQRYPTTDDAIRVADDAKIDYSNAHLDTRSITTWASILRRAHDQRKLTDLLVVVGGEHADISDKIIQTLHGQNQSSALPQLITAPVAPPPNADNEAGRKLLATLINITLGLWSKRPTRQSAIHIVLGSFSSLLVIWFFFGWMPLVASVFLEDSPEHYKPAPGYSISYNGFPYAVNNGGQAVVIVSPISYLLARVTDTAFPVEISNSTMRTGSMALKARVPEIDIPRSSVLPGPAPSQPAGPGTHDTSSRWPRFANAILPAHGMSDFASHAYAQSQREDALRGRLYVQSVKLPNAIQSNSVNASFFRNAKSSAQSLTRIIADVPTQAQLLIKGGSTISQDYQLFFDLPDLTVSEGSYITLQSTDLLSFVIGYNETFNISSKLELGKPTTLTGSAGGQLIVQLTLPIDVVFFERLGTSAQTKKLLPLSAASGFVTRLNAASSSDGGQYNVIYSGSSVPDSVLQEFVRIILNSGSVNLKYIQPRVTLNNGIQTQIQVGTNESVSCLPVLTAAQIEGLKGTPAQFENVIQNLQQPNRGNSCD